MQERVELSKALVDPTKREERLARIAEIEDRIYQRASGVLEAVLSFHEVSPNQQEPPEQWVEEYGLEGARQRLAVAKSGWLPPSHAPTAPKLALQFVAGVRRAQGKVNIGKQEINVKLNLPAPTSAKYQVTEAYETREIE